MVNKCKAIVLVFISLSLIYASAHTRADCNPTPFTDISGSPFICQIAQAYFSGLTNGTSATTFSPNDPVTREQVAAFVSRTLDQSLKRGSRRAVLDQWWTPQTGLDLGITVVGSAPELVKSDGQDLWVINNGDSISRVRASDGKLLETWTGASNPYGILVAAGRVWVTASFSPGRLYVINPQQQPGNVSTVTSNLGDNTHGITFDGTFIWTANTGLIPGGSLSRVNPVSMEVTTYSAGVNRPWGIICDGSSLWVTDNLPNGQGGLLHQVDFNGNVIRSIPVGESPWEPAFDGTNIWVPSGQSSVNGVVTVVRASNGTVLATLINNALVGPFQAAFDGERIMVTGSLSSNVALWKADDLTPLGLVSTGNASGPLGVCSDGLNFWITLSRDPLRSGKLARF